MIGLSDTLSFYKRKDVQDAIVSYSKDREVAVKFGDKGFGKRPDVLNYPRDILELVKQNATSFHISEEIWQNPLQLSPEMRREQLDENRGGWDLVLDIDCPFLEYSAIAGSLIVQALKYHGVKSVSCKFSGNHGFHIGIPFEAFPEKVRDKLVKDLFPEAPRVIAAYIKYFIKEQLGAQILAKGGLLEIIKKTGKKKEELVNNGKFNPFSVLEIDTVLIASRHLYRAPYSFNEKSGLISIPINPEKILKFDKRLAEPNNVKVNRFVFLDRSGVAEDEAKRLFVESYDYDARNQENINVEESLREENKVKRSYDDSAQKAVPQDFFPPCVKNILKGLQDGKKRSLFILTNFLTCCNWGYEDIESLLYRWNKRNNEKGEQLREVMIKGQLRYHKQRKKKIPPPNCRRAYEDFQVCKPDALCVKIKNPVQYAKRKAYFARKDSEKEEKKGRARLTEEQKEMRRKYREKMRKGKDF
ncbi:hypothetical protein KY345_04160 [Candidatus Woesearchaeota archaeon]|nr:hypothetical protein [Candidatus Woesearchaeota archaeon]